MVHGIIRFGRLLYFLAPDGLCLSPTMSTSLLHIIAHGVTTQIQKITKGRGLSSWIIQRIPGENMHWIYSHGHDYLFATTSFNFKKYQSFLGDNITRGKVRVRFSTVYSCKYPERLARREGDMNISCERTYDSSFASVQGREPTSGNDIRGGDG